jgi:hypothetical protein
MIQLEFSEAEAEALNYERYHHGSLVSCGVVNRKENNRLLGLFGRVNDRCEDTYSATS